MPCEKPRKKMRPKGRILHFAGSRSKIFQVSPEPNDASNAKFKLSIANYSKTSAICWRHSAKNAKGNRDYAPSFVERVCPASTAYFNSAPEILRGYQNISWLAATRYQRQMTITTIRISTSKPTRKNASTHLPTIRHKLRRRTACRNSSTD